MDKIDRMLLRARKLDIVQPYIDYALDKLTTEELKELIDDDITEDRRNEILEPVKFINRDPNSPRMKLSRLSEEELGELIDRYERINEG